MTYQVIITRKDVKGISMRINKGGEVHLSAPFDMPQEKIDAFIQKNERWIENHIVKAAEQEDNSKMFFAKLPLGTREEKSEASRRLDSIVRPLVERYAELMGVNPGAIAYSPTTSQWGRCMSGSNRLQFSLYLLLLPEWCIEHVVVHELAHIIVPNHSADFYRVMDKYFPRWREARAETARLSNSGDNENM